MSNKRASHKCPYVVTRSGDQNCRCHRATNGRLLCPMHRETVLKVLDAVNDELIAALRKKCFKAGVLWRITV